MEVKVKSFGKQGKDGGSVTLNPSIYGLPWRPDIVSQVVRWQRAKAQAGTHATKNISFVSGTTRKPYKQKGTGRARQGSLRSVQFRGGGVIFGPVPRSHEIGLPKKVRRLGVKVALSQKAQSNTLHVFKDFEIEAKTSNFVKHMQEMNIKNALFVGDKESSEALKRCLNNVYGFDFLPDSALNVLDIVKKENVIISKSSLQAIEERLA